MKSNIGTADRVIRVVLALILLSLLFIVEGPGRWLGLIGLVPLLTALVRWCPAYWMLQVSTCGHEAAKQA